MLFGFQHEVWLINHHHMCTTPFKRFWGTKWWQLITLHQQKLQRGAGEDVRTGGVVKEDRSYTHRSNNSACSPYFSRCSCRLSSSAGTGRLVFELQPDSFVKTWTECDLFIKRRSVPWHLQHPLKWRCITYFTRRVKSHPSLRLSPSWNVVQLAGC